MKRRHNHRTILGRTRDPKGAIRNRVWRRKTQTGQSAKSSTVVAAWAKVHSNLHQQAEESAEEVQEWEVSNQGRIPKE